MADPDEERPRYLRWFPELVRSERKELLERVETAARPDVDIERELTRVIQAARGSSVPAQVFAVQSALSPSGP